MFEGLFKIEKLREENREGRREGNEGEKIVSTTDEIG